MASFDFGSPNNNGLLLGLQQAAEGGLKGFLSERARQDLEKERELKRLEQQKAKEDAAKAALADDQRLDESLFLRSNDQLRRGTAQDLEAYLRDPEGAKKNGLIAYSFRGADKPSSVYLPKEGYVSKAQVELNKNDRVDKMVGTKKQEKEEQYTQQTRIPDFELAPGFKPATTAVEKFRSQKSTVEKMDETAAKLQSLVTKAGGSALIPGQIKSEIQSLLRQLQIQAKTYNELGVLNGPDIMILTEQIGDPTSVTDVLSRGGTDLVKQYDTVLNTLRTGIKSGLETEGKNLGFRRVSGGGLINTASSDPNREAMEWLKNNPNDPDAPAVRKKLGL